LLVGLSLIDGHVVGWVLTVSEVGVVAVVIARSWVQGVNLLVVGVGNVPGLAEVFEPVVLVLTESDDILLGRSSKCLLIIGHSVDE